MRTANVTTGVTEAGTAGLGDADDGTARASCPDAAPATAPGPVAGPGPCRRVHVSRNVAEFFFIGSRNSWKLHGTGSRCDRLAQPQPAGRPRQAEHACEASGPTERDGPGLVLGVVTILKTSETSRPARLRTPHGAFTSGPLPRAGRPCGAARARP